MKADFTEWGDRALMTKKEARLKLLELLWFRMNGCPVAQEAIDGVWEKCRG